MKITMEIPDDTVLATVSIAVQEIDKPYQVRLGVFPIASSNLKDGSTVDFKSSYESLYKKGSEDTECQTE